MDGRSRKKFVFNTLNLETVRSSAFLGLVKMWGTKHGTGGRA
jgi:hypothetical protein